MVCIKISSSQHQELGIFLLFALIMVFVNINTKNTICKYQKSFGFSLVDQHPVNFVGKEVNCYRCAVKTSVPSDERVR